ncbi:MAG: hypothetical protein NTX97_10675 [Bacteroidetes bacterium]|nr:hypothetical protein [Bacteroidota bacterium]
MKNLAIRTFATLMLCLLVFHSFSQIGFNKDSLITSKIANLTTFWNKYNDLSNSRPDFENYAIIPELYSIKASDSLSIADYQNKVNDAKIHALKQNLGLEGTANYLENFNTGFNADDILAYNRRLQAGLDWNILSDGLVNNRYKEQILKNENIINSLKPITKLNGNDFITVSHKIIYSFNIQKIKLLQKRQQIIDDKISIANELYLLKHLPRLDLLQIMQQQVDIASMDQIYKSYNDQLSLQINESTLPKKVLPLFDVDISKAFSFSENNSMNDSILKLEIENLELAHKPLSDVRLNTQLRYNYYDLSKTTNVSKSFISAGLGLAVPIPLGIKANKEVISAQAKLLEYQQKENASTGERDLLNTFYEFRYKLKQYNNFFEKRKKYEELIRIERVKEKFGDFEFNPLSALNLLDELLAVDIEMLDLQQDMYLQLLDINSKIPGSEVSAFIKPYSSDTMKVVREKTEKAMYIWSEAQIKYTPEYIEEYLRLNKISTAIISLKKDNSNKTEALNLFSKLASKGIRSELLVGNNKLLSSKDPSIYFDSLTNGLDLTMISAIHLDVEPHVLNDYDTNKEKYLNQYIDLLKKTKLYCAQKGLKLCVSIPVFYPEVTLKEIYAQADLVYLMAYEHPNAGFIIKKVKEEFAIDADKTIIALRAKDFKNRMECEQLIKELNTTLNATKFALHDLETFVKLDELSVIQEK